MSLVTPSQQEYHERWKAAQSRLFPAKKPARAETPRNERKKPAPRSRAVPYQQPEPEPEGPSILDLVAEMERSLLLPRTVESRGRKVSEIQRVVCDYFHIEKHELVSDRRARNVTLPRQIGMYLSRKLTKRSMPEIGRRFGKDHTTVIHAAKKIGRMLETDPDIAEAVDTLTAMLRPA